MKFLLTLTAVAATVAGCQTSGNGGARAQEEYKARPACAGMVGEATWAACMERFKTVRPRHPPTELQYADWRT